MEASKINATSREKARRQMPRNFRVINGSRQAGSRAQDFKQALQALNTAYTEVAHALRHELQRPSAGLAEISALGARYCWVADRRRLIKTFLDSEPAAIAYANHDCRHPEQIRSLAEAATEFAGSNGSLLSALGLLNYIDEELGWAANDASQARL